MPDIYRDLDYTADQVDEAIQTIGIHVANNAIHVNQSEKDNWNAKADSSALSTETSAREAADTALQTAVNSKADASALTSEISARETADASINSRISAIETDQQRQETEIGAVAALGAKNLFPITAVSQTIGGITFTVNDDGTVTVNGTKTNNDWFMLSENNSFDAGTYTLSDGLPNDTTGCMLIITTARSMSAAIMATAVNSRPQTKTFTTAQTGLYYAIRISSGTTVNNLTFKPMIRRAEITDSTFATYAPTNRELYETKTEQTETNVIANLGPKNLFRNTAVSKTYQGVTFTVNADGTVSLSGTAENVVSVLEIGTVTPPAGSYIISGCPAGGSWSTGTNKYRIRVSKNGSWLGDETGNGYTVTVNGNDVISLQINSAVGLDTEGLVFKPMLRPAEITDDTFVPYAPTNRELYEMILALQSGRSVQSSAASLMQAGRLDAAEQTNINDPIADSDM